jgi:Uma2 family endonuclease
MATTRPLTVEDLAEIDEPGRFDLIRGELIRMPPAGGEHGRIAVALGARLYNFVTDRALGTVFGAETGFILDKQAATVLAPDIAFIRASRLPAGEVQSGFVPIVPDLVVEIVSPSDRLTQVQDKVLAYLEYGVGLVWVVDSRRRTVTVYHPDRTARVLLEDDLLTGEDILPGFEVRISAVFG